MTDAAGQSGLRALLCIAPQAPLTLGVKLSLEDHLINPLFHRWGSELGKEAAPG